MPTPRSSPSKIVESVIGDFTATAYVEEEDILLSAQAIVFRASLMQNGHDQSMDFWQ